MRYIMFSNRDDHEKGIVYVEREEFYDFEKMMKRFTLLSETRNNVLVIEPDTKKVVCHFQSEGKVLFNKVLLDGTIFLNDSE